MSALLQATSPEIILVLVAGVMYLAGTFAAAPCRCWFWASIGTLALAAVTLVTCAMHTVLPETAVVTAGGLATYGRLLALGTGLALVLLSESMALDEHAPEFFASLLLVVAGSMIVAEANELVLLFLGLELVSIPIYVMLYLPKHDAAGQEATAKYFFLSVFSSAMFLYGVSFVYGAVGSTNLAAIAAFQLPNTTASAAIPAPSLFMAVALILAGLGFKIAAAPFHFYAPDVYQGTTNSMAALLAWAPKAAGVFAMLRLVTMSLPTIHPETAKLAGVIAAASMTLGNVLGLLQNNLRRLLAYSSIAHAGYMMLGIATSAVPGSAYLTAGGGDAVAFYLLAYAAMTIGVFAVIVYLSSDDRPVETVDDLAGLVRSHPAVAVAMAIFLFSLTGIPITAGFWGKLAIFSGALATHDKNFTRLAVLGVINAAISSYYYLRIIGVMFMQESYTPVRPRGGRPALAVVAACAMMTMGVGFAPNPFLKWARLATPALEAAAKAHRDSAANFAAERALNEPGG